MKKKVSFALCTALMLCSMSVAALAAEPMTEADTVSTMISAADTLPGISTYPAEVRASEENGVYRLEKVYYLTAKDDPATIPTADFEREGRTYTLLDLLRNNQTETDTREHIEVVTLESSTFAFSAASRSLCIATLSALRSMPSAFLNSETR